MMLCKGKNWFHGSNKNSIKNCSEEQYVRANCTVGPGLLPGNLRFARQFRCLTRRFKISNDNFTMKSVKYLFSWVTVVPVPLKYLVFFGNSSANNSKYLVILSNISASTSKIHWYSWVIVVTLPVKYLVFLGNSSASTSKIPGILG